MKTRLATLTTILATATLALTACAGGSGSSTAQSEATTQEATASSTRTITDHAGNEVVLPATITRVAIDQIPIESTYLAYFDGKAPYLVGMSAARVTAMSQTIAAEMAPLFNAVKNAEEKMLKPHSRKENAYSFSACSVSSIRPVS